MNYKGVKKKLLAAETLLMEPVTSFERFYAVKELAGGIDPRLDEFLERAETVVKEVEKVVGLQIFSLSAEILPEGTEEQKKRKKAIVFFLEEWHKVQLEVERVDRELTAAHASSGGTGKGMHFGKILAFAKGPVGIVTIVAVGAIVVAGSLSTNVTISNDGCDPITPVSLPFPLPDLSLPKTPIESGGSAIATIPPVPVTVDGTQTGMLIVHALGYSTSFQLQTSEDVTIDGVSLIGTTTSLSLWGKDHDLKLICRTR